MSSKILLIYLSIIAFCTFAGFQAGEYLRSAEDVFSSHQEQLYYGTFPRVKTDQKELLREMHKMRLQLITLITSTAGFLFGVVLITRNDSLLSARRQSQVLPAKTAGLC